VEFDDWARQLYLSEVALQCTFVQRAHVLIEYNIAEARTPDHAGLAFALHAFLAAAGNVSKLLFPLTSRQRGDSDESLTFRQVRGERLRKLLDVSDDSPLALRRVRNFFEHMDEYLDRWLIRQPRLTAQQLESGTQPRPPAEPRPPLREINPARRQVTFYGETVDVGLVAREVDRIRQKVVELEPAEYIRDPVLWALLTMLPPFPKELRLEAPTRRPDEPVTAGLPPQTEPNLEQAIEEALRFARESLDTPPADEG
jgi:hypothetical protein